MSPPVSRPANTRTEAPFEDGDIRFTAIEVEQLQRLAPEYFRSVHRRPSPRAIRTLLFKIQLYRLLLQLRLPGRPKRDRTIEAVLAAFKAASRLRDADEPPVDEAVLIGRQVVRAHRPCDGGDAHHAPRLVWACRAFSPFPASRQL